MYEFITVNSANLYIYVISGVARVIVLGRQVASGEGILEVCPPPHFYTDLDFSNGLQHNWGEGSPPLTTPLHVITKLKNIIICCISY